MNIVLHGPLRKWTDPYITDVLSVGCRIPFKRFDIHLSGEITICCFGRLPQYCGNMLTDSPEQILNNSTRLTILNDMQAGMFTYCTDQCPYLHMHLSPSTTDKLAILVPLQELHTAINTDSYMITCAYDESCNLQCPSCRNNLIVHKLGSSGPNAVKSREIHEKVKIFVDSLIDIGAAVTLIMSGMGDPFASPLFWQYLLELSTRELPESLRIRFTTNGVLMTASAWEDIRPLWKHIGSVAVSVDAARKETYVKVRKNGNFAKLTANLQHLDQLVNVGSFTKEFTWSTNIVVQSENYQELKEFTEWQLTYKTLDSITYMLINFWPHLTQQEYQDKLLMPNLASVLSDPIFNHPKVILGRLTDLLPKGHWPDYAAAHE